MYKHINVDVVIAELRKAYGEEFDTAAQGAWRTTRHPSSACVKFGMDTYGSAKGELYYAGEGQLAAAQASFAQSGVWPSPLGG